MDENNEIILQCLGNGEFHHIATGEYTIGRGWLNVSTIIVENISAWQIKLAFFPVQRQQDFT